MCEFLVWHTADFWNLGCNEQTKGQPCYSDLQWWTRHIDSNPNPLCNFIPVLLWYDTNLALCTMYIIYIFIYFLPVASDLRAGGGWADEQHFGSFHYSLRLDGQSDRWRIYNITAPCYNATWCQHTTLFVYLPSRFFFFLDDTALTLNVDGDGSLASGRGCWV